MTDAIRALEKTIRMMDLKENKMYKLIKRSGQVVFQSKRKIDAIYEHVKYSSSHQVRLVHYK